MKTNLITSILPQKLLQRKINIRNALFASNIIISNEIAPEIKAALEENQVSLGRFIGRKNSSLSFAPIKDGLFKGQTEMTVNKDINFLHLGNLCYIRKQSKPVLKSIVERYSQEAPNDFINNLKKFLNTYIDNKAEEHIIIKNEKNIPIYHSLTTIPKYF